MDQKLWLFCCAGNVGPMRVQSDLLDRIAFEALPLVVCTKGPMYKKVVDTSGIADPTSTCCRPVLLAHAALL